MRIIAGSLGGRTFQSPQGHRTHPMSDKIRGALFNALGELDGLTVLDAFAGSGAISFEAISRGADQVTALDNDREAQQTVTANIARLDVGDRVHLVKAAVSAWLTTSSDVFDIVIADPPYDDVQLRLLTRLAERVKSGGLFVASLPTSATCELADGFKLLSTKSYGDAQLVFYRRIG